MYSLICEDFHVFMQCIIAHKPSDIILSILFWYICYLNGTTTPNKVFIIIKVLVVELA